MALAFSSLESMAAADLLFYNGKVFTAEPGQGLQQAVAVADGRILKVGIDVDILSLKDAMTQVIDLKGKVLMPGFIDSHSHAVLGGSETCVSGS